MTKTIFYAVNADGKEGLFATLPKRHEGFGVWCGNTSGRLYAMLTFWKDEGFPFPDLTFKDEPYPIQISFGHGE